MTQSIIQQHINACITAKQALLAPYYLERINQVGAHLIQVLKQHTLFTCGNGGSAADAQHFSAELINRFISSNRPPLPCLALTTDTSTLTAIGNDFHFSELFSKQISAHGKEGDCLFVISTSGQSPNILRAIEIAKEKKLSIVLLTNQDGGQAANLLSEGHPQHFILKVPCQQTAVAQECHINIIHNLCYLIEDAFTDNQSMERSKTHEHQNH
jgi:DnaA initiator-associating protein